MPPRTAALAVGHAQRLPTRLQAATRRAGVRAMRDTRGRTAGRVWHAVQASTRTLLARASARAAGTAHPVHHLARQGVQRARPFQAAQLGVPGASAMPDTRGQTAGRARHAGQASTRARLARPPVPSARRASTRHRSPPRTSRPAPCAPPGRTSRPAVTTTCRIASGAAPANTRRLRVPQRRPCAESAPLASTRSKREPAPTPSVSNARAEPTPRKQVRHHSRLVRTVGPASTRRRKATARRAIARGALLASTRPALAPLTNPRA